MWRVNDVLKNFGLMDVNQARSHPTCEPLSEKAEEKVIQLCLRAVLHKMTS